MELKAEREDLARKVWRIDPPGFHCSWPKDVGIFGPVLSGLAPLLDCVGIQAERGYIGHGRGIRLYCRAWQCRYEP